MKRKLIIYIVVAAVVLSSGFLFSQVITKGLIGKQDFSLWDGGASKTFTRQTSEGYDLTLNKIDWPGVDVLQVYGGGAARTHIPISSAVSATSASVTPLWLSPGTWTIGANTAFGALSVPVIPPGAILSVSSGFTLTFSGTYISAGGYQIFTGNGDLNFADGTELRSSWFASLSAAVAYIGTNKVKIVVDHSEAISADLTIPSNIELDFVNGAVLTVATTKTLTVAGPIRAGPSKIFDWAGTGAISCASRVDTVMWFGAVGDGVTDDTAAIQKAIDANSSIFIPPGTYKISTMLGLTTTRWEIQGVKGKTILKASADIGIIGPTAIVVAEYGVISGITFTSETGGQGTGIYAVGPADERWDLSHWTISNCTFSGKLKCGINACMIGTRVERCDFGLLDHGHAVSQPFQAIKALGTVTPEVPPNANVISGCEFAVCGYTDYTIEFSNGYKVLIEDCIFENNYPNSALIHFDGIAYPTINNCWFENQTTGTCIIKTDLAGSVDSIVMALTNNLINCAAGPTTEIIDWGTTSNKNLVFRDNFLAQGTIPISTDSYTMVDEIGNYSTNSAYNADAASITYGAKTQTLTALRVRSDQGVTASTATATPVNILTTVAEGLWLVTAWVANGSVDYHATAVVLNSTSGLGLMNYVHGTGMTLTVSSTNIQATQSSGTAQVISYNILRLN